jgi:Zn-dependent peptidase ImmA (M78 family)
MYFSEWRKQQRINEGINLFRDMRIIDVFIPYAKKYLKLKGNPKIKFVEDPTFAKRIGAFGQINGSNNIVIDIKDRHPMDILRTTAHELVHLHQHQTHNTGTSHAGSKTENESNAIAGEILRKFGSEHSELFSLPSLK